MVVMPEYQLMFLKSTVKFLKIKGASDYYQFGVFNKERISIGHRRV